MGLVCLAVYQIWWRPWSGIITGGFWGEDRAVQDAEWFEAFLGLLGYKA